MSLWWLSLPLLLAYVFLKIRFRYWKRRGVDSPEATFPFGSINEVVVGRAHLGLAFCDYYTEWRGRPFLGTFMLHRPVLLLRDLDLIKTFLTKDFGHFSDHGLVTVDEKVDPLAAHLFNLTGEKWRNLRYKLTPTFTSRKMKHMFSVMRECSLEMERHMGQRSSVAATSAVDLREILTKFSTDVIGNCAFGVSCNCFRDPNAVFYTMGKRAMKPSFIDLVVSILDFLIPGVFQKLRMAVIGNEIQEFFCNLVEKTIKHREEKQEVRNDFLQLLMLLRHSATVDGEGEGKEAPDDGTRLTTMQIAAQVFVFFIAGFETSSTTASFALYELALNPDVQEKARAEIDSVLQRHGGEVTYDALGDMTYLSLVVDETLRKYPPLAVLFRICTKEYVIPGTEIRIEKDTPVMIPVLGIQRDPDIYPDPMRFDPERFTPENKASRHHFAYMPFGEGPRICIGSRFGLMQTKLALVSILSKYRVSPCDRTLIPMKYDKRSFILTADGGMWLKLSARTPQ